MLAKYFELRSKSLYHRFKCEQQHGYDLKYRGLTGDDVTVERSMEDPQSWECVHCCKTGKPYNYIQQYPNTHLV